MKFYTVSIQMPCKPGGGRYIHRFVWRKNTSSVAVIMFGAATSFISVTPRGVARSEYYRFVRDGGTIVGDPNLLRDTDSTIPDRPEVLKALNKLVNSP